MCQKLFSVREILCFLFSSHEEMMPSCECGAHVATFGKALSHQVDSRFGRIMEIEQFTLGMWEYFILKREGTIREVVLRWALGTKRRSWTFGYCTGNT